MKNSTPIKHYALTTRNLARKFTEHLKSLGYETTQPRSKNCNHWLVSTCTKIKKPCKKVVFNVVNGIAQAA